MPGEADRNVAETLVTVEPRRIVVHMLARTPAAFRREPRRWVREPPETRHAR